MAQSHDDLELIVVDDASTDATAEVVAGFKDSRMRYLRHNENLGVSRARNLGIEQARGSLIAFQDSDDEWRLDKLSKQISAFGDDDNAVLILCGDLVVNQLSMSYLGIDSGQSVVDVTEMVRVRIPGAQCFLARRDALLAEHGFDPALNCFEDWELALRLTDRGRVLLVNEPLVMREQTPGSLFSTERNFARNLRIILEKHQARFEGHPLPWAFYCNLLGQSECLFGNTAEGRKWFLKSLAARPLALRGWVSLLASLFGTNVFRAYVKFARSLRHRGAISARPLLYMRRN